LRRYRAQGTFPVNTYAYGEKMPIFRDAAGTLCAMGYLVHESGRSDLVDGIVEGMNFAYIHEMAPSLEGWLASEGLTAEEAALVQPSNYNPPIGRPPVPPIVINPLPPADEDQTQIMDRVKGTVQEAARFLDGFDRENWKHHDLDRGLVEK